LTAAQAVLDDTIARLEQRRYALDEQRQLAYLRDQAVQLGDPTQLQQQLNVVRQQIEQLNRQLDEEKQMQQQLARLETETTLLHQAMVNQPAIQQRLDAVVERLAKDDYGADERRAIERLKAKSRALGYNRDAHLALRAQIDELAQWERDAVRLEEASKQAPHARATLRRDQAQLQRIDGELVRLADDIAVLQEELAEQQMVERQRRAAEQRLEVLRTRRDAAYSALGRADADLQRCSEAERQLTEQQAEATKLAEERATYEELVQAFGKKGVQAMLIETAIPEIENEANELLGRMTDGQMHVAFETQRDTKTGNNTIETLDIRIADTLGTRDYTMYSGGEAFRVNFALRIALSKLLARRAGASLKTLIIDEGFGTQDAQGRDRIVEAINAIENEFERILVITHIQELKDMFPAQIEITKTGQGSQWSIA
jgi:exonuclease SbcC